MKYAPRHARRAHTRVVLPVISGVLAAVIVLVGGYSAYSYTRFTTGVTHVDALSKPSGAASDDLDGTAQNILLVGDDERPPDATPEELHELGTDAHPGTVNTDTVIVLHIAADGRSATMLSLPRDSWVDIPGHGKGRINSAYPLGKASGGPSGGAQLLTQTVQDLTGLTIDHYVQVSLIKFYRIVQVLGPVQVCLNNPVKDSYTGINLPAGVQKLAPNQALQFVCQRHGLPRGDIDRTVRQQYFLAQEAKQVLTAGTLLNPVKTTRVLDTVKSSLTTDDGLNFLQLATQLRNLRPGDIRSDTLPVTFGTIGGNDVDIVDTAGMPAYIQSLIGPPQAYTDAKAASPAGVNVTVLNGSGVTGAAAAASSQLTALGFAVGTPGSSTSTASTLVEYPAGMEAQAKAVADAVPGATAVLTSTVSSVTLLLGKDGKVPSSGAPAATDPGAAADSAPAEEPSKGSSKEPSKASEPSSTPAGNAYGTDGSCIN
jgi:LCP family protein required for cell wall assembly